MAGKRVTAGSQYLAGWRDIPGSDRRALDPFDEPGSDGVSLGILTRLGYSVLISGNEGNYYVRCLPLRKTPYRVGQEPNLYYCGEEIGYILACAAYEADLLCVTPKDAIFDDMEQLRWAAR